MSIILKILIYVIVLLIIIIIARIIGKVYQPVIKDTKTTFKKDTNDTNDTCLTLFNEYMTAVYCKNNNCKISTTNYEPFPLALIDFDISKTNNSKIIKTIKTLNIKNTLHYFNYIYDNAPRCILDKYPIADNLSFSWPPAYGTRYKLTAFPYPKSSNIFQAVYQIISNTVDAYTFPAWSIQKRNPLDFNNCIYSKENNYFRDYQDVEVVHACYPPPGAKYPFCDDGGWWLYLANGSGVFWNTGKCIVSNNKISLLYDLYNCSTKLRREVGALNQKITEDNKNLSPDKQKKLIDLPPIVGLSINDIVDKLKDKGGGKSITVAIFSIVNSLVKHQLIPKIVGFKDLSPSKEGRPAWNNFISRTFLIVYLIVVAIIQFLINLRGKSIPEIIGLLILLVIIIAFLLYIFIFVVFEDFFRGLGWMTLDMALDKTGMTLYEFVEECITGKLKNHTCNSLAMAQMFDYDLEVSTFAMKYDSFILTSQPNKTGTWEVEICDLRRFDPNNKTKGIVLDGGVCDSRDDSSKNKLDKGVSFDLCKNKIVPGIKNSYILKSGPIVIDNLPPFYKPTQECKCIENVNRLCTSCEDNLSAKLCKK
jgi:hypothetical protein